MSRKRKFLLSSFNTPNEQITDLATIDSSLIDNGYLTIARRCNPQASLHGNFAQAATNLTGGNPLKVIVGHGDRGVISTGTGENLSKDSTKFISNANVADWQQAFSNVLSSGACSALHLYGCECGASQQGAQLLFQLAQTLQCPVYGATGFIYIDDQGHFTLEPRSTWQFATPNQMPAPIEPPSQDSDAVATSLVTTVDEKKTVLKLSKINAVSFYPISSRNLSDAQVLTVDRKSIPQLVNQLMISNPVQLPGIPAAMITGSITLQFNGGITKTFNILNDRLLQDVENPQDYYYCTPNIRSQILSHI